MDQQQGFVLTRHWRDTPQGTQVEFWLATDARPRLVQLPHQTSVAFFPADPRGHRGGPGTRGGSAATAASHPGLRLHAAIPKEMAHGLGSIEISGREVQLHQVRFTAEPSAIAPSTFDVVCFVPTSALTEVDPQDVPGALVANIVLSMGIGELRMMTRVSRMGIAVMDQPPPEAIPAWDLVEIIDGAPTH